MGTEDSQSQLPNHTGHLARQLSQSAQKRAASQPKSGWPKTFGAPHRGPVRSESQRTGSRDSPGPVPGSRPISPRRVRFTRPTRAALGRPPRDTCSYPYSIRRAHFRAMSEKSPSKIDEKFLNSWNGDIGRMLLSKISKAIVTDLRASPGRLQQSANGTDEARSLVFGRLEVEFRNDAVRVECRHNGQPLTPGLKQCVWETFEARCTAEQRRIPLEGQGLEIMAYNLASFHGAWSVLIRFPC